MFYSKLFGTYLIILSLVLLIRRDGMRKIMTDFLDVRPFVAFTGWFSIFLGLIVVLTHNLWLASAAGVVTFIGWFLLAQGLWRVLCTESFLRFARATIQKGYSLVCWIWLLVGLYLTWSAYV